jgi:spermidine synthase
MATLIDKRVEGDSLIELVRREDDVFDVMLDGRKAMSSDARRHEKPLVELSLALWKGRDDISVLLGGLGMGFLLREVLDWPGVVRADVVEVSPAVIEWEQLYFSKLNGQATRDKRVHVHQGDLADFLTKPRAGTDFPPDGWFATILDLDEWPGQLTRPSNQLFYTPEGLERLEDALRPGGVIGLWTTVKDNTLFGRLGARFQNVAKVGVPVEIDGNPDVHYVYRGRRKPTKVVN